MPDDYPPPGAIEVPAHRPDERFWPYVDVQEQPDEEELVALDPDLRDALYGPSARPFSLTLVFSEFGGADFHRALELARASAEYRVTTAEGQPRHRARFVPTQAAALRDLFEIVGRVEGTEVLIDDKPVPYARELWLPLFWFLV